MLGLAVILAGQFVPGFKIDLGAGASLLIVIMSYLYGVTVDPGPGGWKGVIQSRKFWAAAVGFALVVMDGAHVVLPEGLTQEMLVMLATLIGGFIVSAAKQPGPIPPGSLYGGLLGRK